MHGVLHVHAGCPLPGAGDRGDGLLAAWLRGDRRLVVVLGEQVLLDPVREPGDPTPSSRTPAEVSTSPSSARASRATTRVSSVGAGRVARAGVGGEVVQPDLDRHWCDPTSAPSRSRSATWPACRSTRPAFGHGSRRQHLDAGAREIDGIDVPSVRRDVDDRAGLGAALDLGVGPRTSLVATALRL